MCKTIYKSAGYSTFFTDNTAVSKYVSAFLWCHISEVTERRVHASRKRCLFSCSRNGP